MEEKEELSFQLPNRKTIPCLHCKWGAMNSLASYCVKYDLKPSEVYYESKECPNFEPIKK